MTVVTARVDALTKDAKARRAAIEARVAELQGEAQAFPARVQNLVDDNVAAVEDTYADLVKRGESLVGRIRRQKSTQDTVKPPRPPSPRPRPPRPRPPRRPRRRAKKATTTAKKRAPRRAAAPRRPRPRPRRPLVGHQGRGDAAEKIGD